MMAGDADATGFDVAGVEVQCHHYSSATGNRGAAPWRTTEVSARTWVKEVYVDTLDERAVAEVADHLISY